MKQIKTLFIAATLFIGATTFTNAQSNVAHINTSQLIKAMPEMAKAKADMEKVGKTYQADIESMKKDLKAKTDRFEAEAATKTQEENEKRYVEVQTDNQSISEFAQGAQQQLQKKEFDLLKPITDKAQAAILKVGKAQGFNYVLDSSQGIIIMAEGKDLMADVKRELGM